jgi:hypothetical protein
MSAPVENAGLGVKQRRQTVVYGAFVIELLLRRFERL